jgi:deoxyribonuclease V
MQFARRHDWNVTPAQAINIQNELAADVVADRPLDLAAIRTVAGIDVSVRNDVSHAAIVVMSFPNFEPVEIAHARRPTTFPYVPGLLSFREGAVLEEAFGRLRTVPDVLIFDGNGIMHPRRIGIASHIGVLLDRPAIGSAKSRLCGQHAEVPDERGAWQPLIHRRQVIGAALRTRARCNPVFVSPGHLADLETSIALVMACAPKYRLPEPIRRAHRAAGDFDPLSAPES